MTAPRKLTTRLAVAFVFLACLLLGGAVVGDEPGSEEGGETLHNGIRLPAEWPPKLSRLGPDPTPVPYLARPPRVIPIDVGRQLFVDDFLIQSTTLYNLEVVAYESILLGTFIIWRGDYRFNSETEEAKEQNRQGRPKQNSACIGFSRDGFHWHRPDRRVFLPKSEKPGDWNWGNSQTAAKSPLVVGDKLYFYVAGRAGLTFPGNTYQDAGGSTGLAFLRRDGFASMDAGPEGGTLTTRPLRFAGKHLFVNLDNPSGRLRVEISDEHGNPIAPFSLGNCTTLAADSTRLSVRWKNRDDLSQLAGKSVRFHFELTDGKLYAFWVSPDRSGASYGYVAGGGPGFTTNRDTVGDRSKR